MWSSTIFTYPLVLNTIGRCGVGIRIRFKITIRSNSGSNCTNVQIIGKMFRKVIEKILKVSFKITT